METMTIHQNDQHQRVQHFFNSSESWRGSLYDDRRDRFNLAMVRRKTFALEMLRRLDDLTVGRSLDIGCGCGIYSKELEEMGFETCGIDLSDEMIRECRTTLAIPDKEFDRRFLVAAAERLPFARAEFDLVLSVGLFGYLLHDHEALMEIVRVLKPGGYLFLSVQNIVSLSNVDYAVRTGIRNFFKGERNGSGAALPVPWVTKHSSTQVMYKSYFPGRLKQMVSSYGFSVVNDMTLGYELRLLRRLRLLPEGILLSAEETLEKIGRSIPLAPLKYSGDTYSVLFRKKLKQG